MSDFQSFLFQNMHMIGLEEEEAAKESSKSKQPLPKLNELSATTETSKRQPMRPSESIIGKASERFGAKLNMLGAESKPTSRVLRDVSLSRPPDKSPNDSQDELKIKKPSIVSNYFINADRALQQERPGAAFTNKLGDYSGNNIMLKSLGNISVSTTETFLSAPSVINNSTSFNKTKYLNKNLNDVIAESVSSFENKISLSPSSSSSASSSSSKSSLMAARNKLNEVKNSKTGLQADSYSHRQQNPGRGFDDPGAPKMRFECENYAGGGVLQQACAKANIQTDDDNEEASCSKNIDISCAEPKSKAESRDKSLDGEEASDDIFYRKQNSFKLNAIERKSSELFESNITQIDDANIIEYNDDIYDEKRSSSSMSSGSTSSSASHSRHNLSSPQSLKALKLKADSFKAKSEGKKSNGGHSKEPKNSDFKINKRRDSVMSNDYERAIKSPKLPSKSARNSNNAELNDETPTTPAPKGIASSRPSRLLKKLTNTDFSSFKLMFHKSSRSNSRDDLVEPAAPKLAENDEEDDDYCNKPGKLEKSVLNDSLENNLISDDERDRELRRQRRNKLSSFRDRDGNYDNENDCRDDYDDEEKPDDDVELTLMEPYLNKFEEELLRSSKSDILRDLAADDPNDKLNILKKNFKKNAAKTGANNSSAAKSSGNSSNIGATGQRIQKYFNEFRLFRSKTGKNDGKKNAGDLNDTENDAENDNDECNDKANNSCSYNNNNRNRSTSNTSYRFNKKAANNRANSVASRSQDELNDSIELTLNDKKTGKNAAKKPVKPESSRRNLNEDSEAIYDEADENLIKGSREDMDEEDENNLSDSDGVINLLELKKLTRHQIPWSSLEEKSADLMIGYLGEVETASAKPGPVKVVKLPEISTQAGNKIDAKLVKKWLKVLDNIIKLNRKDLLLSPKPAKKKKDSQDLLKSKQRPKDAQPQVSKELLNKKKPGFDRLPSSDSKFRSARKNESLADETLNETIKDDENLTPRRIPVKNLCESLISSRKSSITSKLYANSNLLKAAQARNEKPGAKPTPTANRRSKLDETCSILEDKPSVLEPDESFIYNYNDPPGSCVAKKSAAAARNSEDDEKELEEKIKRYDEKAKNKKCAIVKKKPAGLGQRGHHAATMDDASNDENMMSLYINQEFVDKTLKRKPHRKTTASNSSLNTSLGPDHFYNEINENFFDFHCHLKSKRPPAGSKLGAPASQPPLPPSMTMTIQSTKHMSVNKKEPSGGSGAESTAGGTVATRNIAGTSKLSSSSHLLSHSTISSAIMPFAHASAFAGSDSCSLNPMNSPFRRPNSSLLAKLKSPERKILYNEWFTIIKKMEKDPKFDLETLVRTRGRFTEHDRISYRDRLVLKQARLRCARSEPNFHSMLTTSSVPDTLRQSGGRHANSSGVNDDNRGGINTAPAFKNHYNKRLLNATSSSATSGVANRLKRNYSTSNAFGTSILDSEGGDVLKSESFSEAHDADPKKPSKTGTMLSKNSSGRGGAGLQDVKANGTELTTSTSLKAAVKLTLQKSDINFIKEILKKKDKSAISELTNLAFGILGGGNAPAASNNDSTRSRPKSPLSILSKDQHAPSKAKSGLSRSPSAKDIPRPIKTLQKPAKLVSASDESHLRKQQPRTVQRRRRPEEDEDEETIVVKGESDDEENYGDLPRKVNRRSQNLDTSLKSNEIPSRNGKLRSQSRGLKDQDLRSRKHSKESHRFEDDSEAASDEDLDELDAEEYVRRGYVKPGEDAGAKDQHNNLMSKCKNRLTNQIYKSESAKAFCDELGKLGSKLKKHLGSGAGGRGAKEDGGEGGNYPFKIGSRLKALTSASSNHQEDLDARSQGHGLKASKLLKGHRILSNISEDQKTDTEDQELESPKKSSKNTPKSTLHGKKTTSESPSKSSSSSRPPHRPPPPKRPPPPRPNSPPSKATKGSKDAGAGRKSQPKSSSKSSMESVEAGGDAEDEDRADQRRRRNNSNGGVEAVEPKSRTTRRTCSNPPPSHASPPPPPRSSKQPRSHGKTPDAQQLPPRPPLPPSKQKRGPETTTTTTARAGGKGRGAPSDTTSSRYNYDDTQIYDMDETKMSDWQHECRGGGKSKSKSSSDLNNSNLSENAASSASIDKSSRSRHHDSKAAAAARTRHRHRRQDEDEDEDEDEQPSRASSQHSGRGAKSPVARSKSRPGQTASSAKPKSRSDHPEPKRPIQTRKR